MQLFFIHNIRIRICNHLDLENLGMEYALSFHYCPHSLAKAISLGPLLIQLHRSQFKQILTEILQLPTHTYANVTLLIKDQQEDTLLLLQQYFKVVDAAGGIVIKDDQILMIYRARGWELPKGKLERGERAEQAAVREVQEECGVKAIITDPFYTTWHFFHEDSSSMLKRTTWYLMNCINDLDMAPQQEEAIEQVAWVTPQELNLLSTNMYANTRLLLRAFQNKQMLKQTGYAQDN
eukprot:gene713-884_t